MKGRGMNRLTVVALAWLAQGLASAAEYPAHLEWSDRVDLSPRVSGTVTEVLVDPGQRVARGAPLVRLDPTIYEARAAQSEARVVGFREEAAEARRDLARQQELFDRTVLSVSELDRAKLRAAQAQAQLVEAEAKLAEDRKNLADTVLVAPFDSVVLARTAQPGTAAQVLLQPQSLVTVARSGEMLARARLGPADASGLAPGSRATVRVGGKSYAGRVKAVTAAGDGYLADVAFSSPSGLKAGMDARVDLP